MEEWWGEYYDDAPSDEGECIPPTPPRRRLEVDEILSSNDDDCYNDCSGTLANNNNGIGSGGAFSICDNINQRIDDNHDGKNHRDRVVLRKSMILRGRHCREGPQSSSSAAVSFSSSPLLEGRWSSPMIIDESNLDMILPAAAARVARFEASLGGRTTPNQLGNDNAQFEHDNPPSCRNNMYQRSRRRNQLEKQQPCLPKQITNSMTDQANTGYSIKDNESTNISSSLHPSFTLISLNSDRRVRQHSKSQKSRFVVPTTHTIETNTTTCIDDRHPSNNSDTSSSSSSIIAHPSISVRASVQSSTLMTYSAKNTCEQHVSSSATASVGSELSEYDVDMIETNRQEQRLSQAGANSQQKQQQQQQRLRPSPAVLNKFMSAVHSNNKSTTSVGTQKKHNNPSLIGSKESNSIPIQQTEKSQQRQHRKYTRLSLAESNNFMTALRKLVMKEVVSHQKFPFLQQFINIHFSSHLHYLHHQCHDKIPSHRLHQTAYRHLQ
jgi:hypothetical protein